MKKILTLIIVSMLLLTSCSVKTKNSTGKVNTALTEKKSVTQIKSDTESALNENVKLSSITCDYDQQILPEQYKDLGFKTFMLSCKAIRNVNKGYSLDSNAFDKLINKINYLESQKTNYVISFSEGPGFSASQNIESIFKNKTECNYFAEMITDVLSKCSKNTMLKGISIDIESSDIDEETYYNTLNYIYSKVCEQYPDLTIIYNLNHSAFLSGYSDDSYSYIPNYNNIIINAVLKFDELNYPGTIESNGSSLKFNRNTMLDGFQNLKEFSSSNGIPVMVTVKVPWNQKSSVFLQDIFELTKMLNFDYNICSSNSEGSYDFSYNRDILRIIKKNSI